MTQTTPLGKSIGLQLYTLGAELERDFAGTLAQVAQIGIKEVEIASNHGRSAAEWKAELGSNGLQCRSMHYFDPRQSPARTMEFANEVGARYIVTSLNPPPDILAKAAGAADWTALIQAVETMSLDEWKKSADIANELGALAAQHALVYAYHNHNVEFRKFGDTTVLETLMSSTDPATVKLEMDCGWVEAAGYSAVELLQKYAERIRLLHIKAFEEGPPKLKLIGPDAPKATELGRGKPDYPPIFAAAANGQVEQYYIEQEPPFTRMTALEAVKADYEYLNSLEA